MEVRKLFDIAEVLHMLFRNLRGLQKMNGTFVVNQHSPFHVRLKLWSELTHKLIIWCGDEVAYLRIENRA